MIFVDTNYFIRFLLHDNENQYQESKQLFLDAADGKIDLTSSTVVFFEVVWVLRSVYGKDRTSLAKTLSQLLQLNIGFEEKNILSKSIELFSENNLSLEDNYNLTFAKSKSIKEFKTFDLQLKKQFQAKVTPI